MPSPTEMPATGGFRCTAVVKIRGATGSEGRIPAVDHGVDTPVRVLPNLPFTIIQE